MRIITPAVFLEQPGQRARRDGKIPVMGRAAAEIAEMDAPVIREAEVPARLEEAARQLDLRRGSGSSE